MRVLDLEPKPLHRIQSLDTAQHKSLSNPRVEYRDTSPLAKACIGDVEADVLYLQAKRRYRLVVED